MKASEFCIRDPYILLVDGVYYLYGSRSETVWEPGADGFDCYRSTDLENWEGPIEIFHKPEGFWADRNYWAPECIAYEGAYYLITTFGAEHVRKGIYVLKAERPEGPFVPYSERLTPQDWTCIDGTIHFEDGRVYLVYSHSFEDTPTGDMCFQELSRDLTHSVSEPKLMFKANEAVWAKPVPFAKEEFGMEGDVYFTDGPCLFRVNDELYMTWSSWSKCAYAVGIARSESGTIDGPWVQKAQPFFPENGGHGMVFADKEGKLRFILHYPNDKYHEHVLITDLKID